MKNNVIKKIVLAVIIVAAILVVLFVGQEVAVRFFGLKLPSLSESKQVNSNKIEFSDKNISSYSHAVTDKYAYFAGTDNVMVVDENGTVKTELSVGVENPIIKTCGNYAILGDLNGNNVYIISGTQINKNIVTINKIKNLSINASGHCVVVTEGDMHKRDVTVYNEKGEELFVWNSGNKLVIDAVIAANNKNILISSLDTQGTTASTVLSFYNISKTEPVATDTVEGEVIASLCIYENYIYCVGESGTYVYTASGDRKSEITYADKNLRSYKVNKNGIVMEFLESTMSDKRYSIEIYSESGRKKTSHSHDYEAKYIDISDNYIVIGRSGLISVLDYNGVEKELLDPGVDLVDLCIIGNTKKMIGFAADGAYIFNLK